MEKAAILSFPQGLPGFENEHWFAAIQIPGQYPLVYLQSVGTPDLCLLALPVQSILPSFKLHLQPEDSESIGLQGEERDIVTLAVITAEPGEGSTANLAAPLVVNLKNNRAVQALQTDSSLSYRHPLISAASC